MKASKLALPTGLLLTGAIWPVVSAQAGDAEGFAALDKNADGYVTLAEAEAEASMLEKFASLDANGDGAVSEVEYMAGKAEGEKSD